MTSLGRDEPQTLRDAHDVASSRRPLPGANLSAWLTWHRSNARMYRYVSEVDRFHHHEARYWMGYEDGKAEEVAAQIQAQKEQVS